MKWLCLTTEEKGDETSEERNSFSTILWMTQHIAIKSVLRRKGTDPKMHLLKIGPKIHANGTLGRVVTPLIYTLHTLTATCNLLIYCSIGFVVVQVKVNWRKERGNVNYLSQSNHDPTTDDDLIFPWTWPYFRYPSNHDDKSETVILSIHHALIDSKELSSSSEDISSVESSILIKRVKVPSIPKSSLQHSLEMQLTFSKPKQTLQLLGMQIKHDKLSFN